MGRYADELSRHLETKRPSYYDDQNVIVNPSSKDNAPDTSRGFTESFAEVPRLFYGLVMGGAEAAEQRFGSGGLASALKEHALEKYIDSSEAAAKRAKPTDSATYAWKQASEKGDYGALVDFAQYWMGYVAGQGVQMVATAGVGSMVAKAAAKKVAEKTVESMVAKQTEKLLAEKATKSLGEAAVKELAVKQVTQKIGHIGETAALAGASFGMEGGEIFGDLIANAELKKEKLSGDDLAKALAWSVGAGALELVGNKFGVDLILGRRTADLAAKAGGLPGRAARATTQATMGAGIEGATEFGQTIMEEAGKGRDPLSRESIMAAIDAAAVGVIGGTTMGGVGGLLTPAVQEQPKPITETKGVQTTIPLQVEPAEEDAVRAAAEEVDPGILQQIGKEQDFIARPDQLNQSQDVGTEDEQRIADQQNLQADPLEQPPTQVADEDIEILKEYDATTGQGIPTQEEIGQEYDPETGEPLPPIDDREPSSIGQRIMEKIRDTTVPEIAEEKLNPTVAEEFSAKVLNIAPIKTLDEAKQAIKVIQETIVTKPADTLLDKPADISEPIVKPIVKESVTEIVKEAEQIPLPATFEETPAEVKRLQEESATPVTAADVVNTKTTDDAIRVANDVVDGKRSVEIPSKIPGQKAEKTVIPQLSLFEQGMKTGEKLEQLSFKEASFTRLETVKEHYDTQLVPKINQSLRTMFRQELADGTAKIDEQGNLTIKGELMKAMSYDEIQKSRLGLDGFEAASFITAGFGKIPFIYSNSKFADGFFNRREENKDYVFMSANTDFHPAAVVSHELFHASPEFRNAIYEIMQEPGMMKKGFTKAARSRHDAKIVKPDSSIEIDRLQPIDLQEEIGSDLLGTAMHDVERFFPKLFKHLDGQYGAPKAQGYVRDFVDRLQTYILDLKERFKQTTFLTAKGKVIAEEYVNDIEAFYEKLAPVVAKHYSKLSPEIAQKGLQGVLEQKTGKTLTTTLKDTTERHFVPVKSETGKLFVAKRDLPVLVKNNEYPHSIIPRGAKLSEDVLKATGYNTPVISPAPEIGSEEEFSGYMERLSTFAKRLDLPNYAKQAVISKERVERTNRRTDVHLSDAKWVREKVSIESLKEQNKDLVVPGEFKGYRRPIMTKGPIVLDRKGVVIDGTNRLLEAVKTGKTSIEVYRPVNTQKQNEQEIAQAEENETATSPRQSGVDPVVLITEAETSGTQKRVNTLLAMVRHYPVLKKESGDNVNMLEKLHDVMVSNLNWLYSLVTPEMRDRAKQWYDGANRMTKEWASIYGVTHEQAAAVMAVTSPQQDWFNNITIAERILHIWKHRQHERVTPAMVAWARSYVSASSKEDPAREKLLLDIKRLHSAGTTLAEMNKYDAARFIRVFDETYHDVAYRITTPEGGYTDYARTTVVDEEDFFGTVAGDKIAKRWLSFNPIEKAVDVLRSDKSIRPDQLSKADKVQNFYRNIFDPHSELGEVTIDTHAVAAAMIRAFSGESKEVKDAWNRAGMYEVYRRAYQDAAFQQKILPREMQSITWEAVRVLFPRTIKNEITDPVTDQWKRYRHGQQSLNQTRKNIFELAGGLDTFMWEKGGNGLFPAQGGMSFDMTVHEDVNKRTARVLQAKPKVKEKAVDTTGTLFSPKNTIRLEHYSRVEGLTTINPEQQGTGQAGAERLRAANAEPGTYVPRSYYYRSGSTPEPRFKHQHQYVVEVKESDLFDMAGSEGDITMIENKAKKDGYVGAYNSEGAMPEAVMLFEAQDVLEPPSVEDLHLLAEQKGLAWDNNPKFMEMTKQVTGKKHLDSLTGSQRLQMQDHLERMETTRRSPKMDENELALPAEVEQEIVDFEKEHTEEIEDLKSKLSIALGGRIVFSPKQVRGSVVKHAVYHGTSRDFESFPIPSQGFNSTIFGNYPVKRYAAFFAKEPVVAEAFAMQHSEEPNGQRLIKLWIDVRRPLDFRDGLSEKDEATLLDGVNQEERVNFVRYLGTLNSKDIWEIFDDENKGADNARILEEAGFDSVIYNETYPGKVDKTAYAVLRSEQASLAPTAQTEVLRSHGHPIRYSNKMTEEDTRFAKEYDDAPDMDPAAVPAWNALRAEIDRQYRDISLKVKIIRVTGQPYADAEEMNAAIAKGSFDVSIDHSEHPLWNLDDNVKFRAVHDYIGHFEQGFDFTLDGERAAYEYHAAKISPEARPALKVEVYGQAAAAIAHNGEFQTQKIFLPQEISKQEALTLKQKTANRKRFTKDSTVKHGVFHTTTAGEVIAKTGQLKTFDEIGVHFGTEGQARDRFEVKRTEYNEDDRYVQHATLKAYISLKKPLRMKDTGTWSVQSMRTPLEMKFPNDAKEIVTLKTPAEIRAFLQRKGYDGIVYKNTGESNGLQEYRDRKDAAYGEYEELWGLYQDQAKTGHKGITLEAVKVAELAYNEAYDDYEEFRKTNAEDSYIVFDPDTQVKSATGNVGTYDATKRNMTLSPKQQVTVNIGLNIGDTKDALTKEEASEALENAGVTILASSVQRSTSENTLVATLDRPLTPEEAHAVSVTLRQQSIAQKVGTEGELYGPGAEQWRPFKDSEFKTQLPELLLAKKKQPPAKPQLPKNFPKPVKYTVEQPTKLDYIVRLLQDKNIDIARMVDTIKHAGGTIPTEANPVLREEMYHKLVSQMDADFENDELMPMLELMRINKVSMDQLNDYLLARHIISDNLNAKLDAMNPNHPDQGKLAGETDAWARQVLANTPATVAPVANRVDMIMKKTRQMMVGYGLETQKTVTTWEQLYKNYVPLRREGFEDEGYGLGPGRSVKGSTVKGRLGSGRAVSDILANIAEARSQVIGRGERQKPVKAMAALLMMHPNKDIAVLAKPAPLTVTNPLTGMIETVPGDITLASGSTYKVPTIKRLNKQTGEVQFLPDPTYKGRPNVVNFQVEGKDYAIVFNEDNDRAMEIAKAFKNLDTPSLNGVMAAVAPYTRFMASMNTQYNPIFGIINFVRDVQFAMLALQNTPLANAKAEVLKNTYQSLEGIYDDARAVRHGLHPSSPVSVMWERFQHVGGPTGYRDIFLTVTDRAKHLQELLTPKGWSELRTPSDLGTKVSKTALFEWLSDYNTTMENAVRLGVFKAAVDRGMTDIEAASLAKNITVNFNKKGQVGAQMGSLYAFFNANVQGTARLAETLFEPIRAGQSIQLSSVGKKIIAGGVLVGILQAFMLALAGYEEDDVPEFVKQKALILPVPGTDKGYVQIPMPLGFNILPNIGRLAAETIIGFVKSGDGKPIEHGYDLIGAMASTFIPTGGSSSLIQTGAPTIVDPIAGLAANEDWTGRPIYREDLDRRNPSPGHTRMRDSATIWSQAISRAINYVTGGNEYRPGVFSPTPDAIDYVISQVTGGVGREASKFSQLIEGAIVGKGVPIYKVPIIGRFVGSASGASSVRDRYYETLKQINVNYNELKGRTKAGDDADEFLAEHPEARLHKASAATETLVHKLQNRRRELIARDAPRDAVKLVEEQMTAAMKRLNDRYIAETQQR